MSSVLVGVLNVLAVTADAAGSRPVAPPYFPGKYSANKDQRLVSFGSVEQTSRKAMFSEPAYPHVRRMHTMDGLVNLMKDENTSRLGRVYRRGAGNSLSYALDFV